jgi:Na+-transporting NADH:ubiquinone oxidoreductase subunit B
MKLLRTIQEKQRPLFEKGGRLHWLYPVYEANDTFLFTPDHVTKESSHVRDGLDLKRMMFTVVIALIPCIFMAMYNTGLQAHLAIEAGADPLGTWQTRVFEALGFGFSSASLIGNVVHGMLYFVPVMLVTYAVGGLLEVLFAIVRKHDVNEGFLVTGMLFPLVLPATIPLWQVALGIAFGVIIGKEVFGGTGMNILNPALTSRAFLFFAYPAFISGDEVWIAAKTSADGYSGATILAEAAHGGIEAIHGAGFTLWEAFIGTVPGSMGETSVLACLIGAAILLITQVGSWRTMAGVTLGTFGLAFLLQFVSSETNPWFSLPWYWHFVAGGWAFGMVFMATDPVSSAFTETGKWVYGILIGVLVVLVRMVNPAFPEGMMLAILFMNVFAATIDHFIVQANIKRRMARYAA